MAARPEYGQEEEEALVDPEPAAAANGAPARTSSQPARGADTQEQPTLAWGCVSTFTLSWLWPIVRKGYSQPLQMHDLPRLPPKLQAERARIDALRWWSAQRKPTLVGMLWALNSHEIVAGCACSAIYGFVNVVARPLLLKVTIETVARLAEKGAAADGSSYRGRSTDSDTTTSVLLVLAIGFSLIIEGVAAASSKHYLSDQLGTAMFGKAGALIQHKSVNLDKMEGVEPSTLIGSDLVKFYESTKLLSLTPMCVTGVLGGFALLCVTLGWAGVLGISVMLVVTAVNFWIGKKIKSVEVKEMAAADERLAIIRQVIQDIKPIKLCSWEESFVEMIDKKRTVECKYMRTYRILFQFSTQIGRAVPFLAACPTFVYMALSGEQLAASDVFAALMVFMSLRLALIMLPTSLSLWAAARVSLNRVEKYLELAEHEECTDIEECESNMQRPLANLSAVVELGDQSSLQFSWPKIGQSPHSDANGSESDQSVVQSGAEAGFKLTIPGSGLEVLPGQMIGVTGAVGSGKSSFLHAILGEMPSYSKSTKHYCTPSVCYVSQRPFIMSCSIRDNICFGAPFVDARMKEACQKAAMVTDLKARNLPHGLNTLVGERGVTLSGGQQMRVALARAFYQNPDLIIADDPLAAVDPAVGKRLFHSLRTYAQGKKSVVLAINQLHLVEKCTSLLHFEAGQLVAQGSLGMVQKVVPRFFSQKDSSLSHTNTEIMTACTNSVEITDVAKETMSQTIGEAVGHDPEVRTMGAVKGSISAKYLKSFGVPLFIVCVATGLLCYAFMGFNDRWLAAWVEEQEQYPEHIDKDMYIGVYIGGTGFFLLFLLVSSALVQVGAAKASRSVHADCVASIMHAPVHYFETTPSGRLISRFSSDVTTSDTNLSQFGDNFIQFTATLVCLLVVVVMIIPFMLIPAVIVCIGTYIQIVAVDRSNREVKRMANTEMAPCLTDISESADARILLRHCKFELGNSESPCVSKEEDATSYAKEFFASRFDRHADTYLCTNFISSAFINWSQQCSYLVAFIFSVVCAVVIVLQAESLSPSQAALALSYSFALPYFLMFYGFIISNIKVALTALERLMELLEVPHEPEWRLPTDSTIFQDLDEQRMQGTIEFCGASLRYSETLPLAVERLDLFIEKGERVGICGRTGAGKSSLVVLLFRLVDACDGMVKISGVDVKQIGLQTLRQRMAVIPQSPLLMEGTIRYNLDPFGKHGDKVLQEVLDDLGLPKDVTLETCIGGGAGHADSGLSAGQRQLLNLGRTLLRNVALVNREPSSIDVLVMDEPTSNIDAETDSRIQQNMIRNRMSGVTVVTIAHRLNTIADHDRILVMDAGKLAECDKPAVLLSKPESYFYKMAEQMGAEDLAALRHRAGCN